MLNLSAYTDVGAECSEPLGHQISPESQLEMSSNAEALSMHKALLYGNPGWCASSEDSHPHIMVS